MTGGSGAWARRATQARPNWARTRPDQVRTRSDRDLRKPQRASGTVHFALSRPPEDRYRDARSTAAVVDE